MKCIFSSFHHAHMHAYIGSFQCMNILDLTSDILAFSCRATSHSSRQLPLSQASLEAGPFVTSLDNSRSRNSERARGLHDPTCHQRSRGTLGMGRGLRFTMRGLTGGRIPTAGGGRPVKDPQGCRNFLFGFRLRNSTRTANRRRFAILVSEFRGNGTPLVLDFQR